MPKQWKDIIMLIWSKSDILGHSDIIIADSFGYSAAFLFLAICAVLAFLVLWLGVPETRDAEAVCLPSDSIEGLPSPELSRS
jgi:predicted MFS family arabinose efflux permease